MNAERFRDPNFGGEGDESLWEESGEAQSQAFWDEEAEPFFAPSAGLAEGDGAAADALEGLKYAEVSLAEVHPAFTVPEASPVRVPEAFLPIWAPLVLAEVEGLPLLPLDGAKRLRYWAALRPETSFEAAVVPMPLMEWAAYHMGKALLRGPLEAHRAQAFLEGTLRVDWEALGRFLYDQGWDPDFLADRLPAAPKAPEPDAVRREVQGIFRRFGRALKALPPEDLGWLLEQLKALLEALEGRARKA
jgi:hypothetical protein